MKEFDLPYRPRLGRTAWAAAAFVGGAVLMGYMALTNVQGSNFMGVHLGPVATSVFQGCVGLVSLAIVAIGLFATIACWLFAHRVTMTSTTLSAPGSVFRREPTVVALRDLRDVRATGVGEQRFLHVVHAGGELRINEACLPDRAVFEALWTALLFSIPVQLAD